jgi:YHS domain-containing protein
MDNSVSTLPPNAIRKSQQFPVIFRKHIYFPSSTSHRNLFIENPHKYISESPPAPSVPITLSIVGPPKSGKSTGRYDSPLLP